MSRDAIRGGPICPHDATHGTIYPMDGYYYCSNAGHDAKGGSGGPNMWDRSDMKPLRYSEKAREATERAAALPKEPKPILADGPAPKPAVTTWTPPKAVKSGRGRPKGHPGNKKLAELGLTFDQYREKMGL